ncbi:MAG: mannose-6-phosphate isomerase [Muribaculaceae bacterium]|nr:mannose-6-phosphate isomerase [Muribaculaceae bacterium]
MLNQPFHFAPYLKTVIWGGDRIAPFKRIHSAPQGVGESWEISAVPGHVSVVDRGPYEGKTLSELVEMFGAELMGHRNFRTYGNSFPLLIKLIDARDDLSVQVHPDDALAMERHGCPGKTEMWHIIDTAPGARIYAGLREKITPKEYELRVADNTLMDVIDCYESAPGDTFFLPAGRIHAIGAGNLLAEIQQTSDITYRIYDYDRRDKDGNPRELHTEQARDAIDYTVYPTYKSEPADDILAECKYFIVRLLEAKAGQNCPIVRSRDSFTIVICTEGEGAVLDTSAMTSFPIRRGDTLLFPATMQSLSAIGPVKLLTVQS